MRSFSQIYSIFWRRITSRALSRLFVRKIKIAFSRMEKQYIYSILIPAFVKHDKVSAKLPAPELVTIASTSVRFALTLFSFNILYAFCGSLTMMRKIPYSDVSATVAAIMRICSFANNAKISLSLPYLFSKKIEI